MIGAQIPLEAVARVVLVLAGFWKGRGTFHRPPVEKFVRISTGAVVGAPLVEVLTNFATGRGGLEQAGGAELLEVRWD